MFDNNAHGRPITYLDAPSLQDQFLLRHVWNIDEKGRIGKGSNGELQKFFYRRAGLIRITGISKTEFVEDCRCVAMELVRKRYFQNAWHKQRKEWLPPITDEKHMVRHIKLQIGRDTLQIGGTYVGAVGYTYRQLKTLEDKHGISIQLLSMEDDKEALEREFSNRMREDPEEAIFQRELVVIANAAWEGILTHDEYQQLFMSVVHGMSSSEIADLIGEKAETVRQRKKRSLSKLEHATRQDPKGRALIEAMGRKP